jgi:hypothetical protein
MGAHDVGAVLDYIERELTNAKNSISPEAHFVQGYTYPQVRRNLRAAIRRVKQRRVEFFEGD